MKPIQYNGFELEYFDSASNFRKYQISLIKQYFNGKFLEVGAGRGSLAFFYKKFLKNITLIEPEIKLFKILKLKFKKDKIKIYNQSIKNIKKKHTMIFLYFSIF